MAREATAAKIVQPLKTKSKWNFADILTKALPRKAFAELVLGMMSSLDGCLIGAEGWGLGCWFPAGNRNPCQWNPR
eukprot:6424208-Ditylum_brightwellii.AAC.1